MLEGVLPCVGDVGGDAVLIPYVLELYFHDEEEDDQEDGGTQGEAQGQPHCCSSGTAVGEGVQECAGQDDCGDICVLEYLVSFHLFYFKVQLALRRFSALRSQGRQCGCDAKIYRAGGCGSVSRLHPL